MMKDPLRINFFPFSSEEDVVPETVSDSELSFVEEVDDWDDNWRMVE